MPNNDIDRDAVPKNKKKLMGFREAMAAGATIPPPIPVPIITPKTIL